MKIEIQLEPAPDEKGGFKNAATQQDFNTFHQSMKKAGLKVGAQVLVQKSADGGMWEVGTYFLEHISDIAPYVTGFAGWFGAYIMQRAGRKVRIKRDNLEIEAGSVAEVERLLKKLNHAEDEKDPE